MVAQPEGDDSALDEAAVRRRSLARRVPPRPARPLSLIEERAVSGRRQWPSGMRRAGGSAVENPHPQNPDSRSRARRPPWGPTSARTHVRLRFFGHHPVDRHSLRRRAASTPPSSRTSTTAVRRSRGAPSRTGVPLPPVRTLEYRGPESLDQASHLDDGRRGVSPQPGQQGVGRRRVADDRWLRAASAANATPVRSAQPREGRDAACVAPPPRRRP